MSHKHTHCGHTHLGYCQVCQLVFCHDCAQEWTPKPTWSFSNTYGTYAGNSVYPHGTVLCHTPPHTHGG